MAGITRTKVLVGQEAKDFYDKATQGNKYTKFGEEYRGVGGYYKDPIYKGLWIAFDFCNGSEVFIEEFTNEAEAKKYANGIEAMTKDNVLI